MAFINIEIKARTSKAVVIRGYLQAHNAVFKGTDVQTDTYFNTAKGRLKLREGNIENNLIYYERADQAGPKESSFSLLEVMDAATLKSMLTQTNGIKIVVEKTREIFFIDNVKFHLDTLRGLGSFVEIEASNKYAPLATAELNRQCKFYMKAFGIEAGDLVTVSYSDMLLAESNP